MKKNLVFWFSIILFGTFTYMVWESSFYDKKRIPFESKIKTKQSFKIFHYKSANEVIGNTVKLQNIEIAENNIYGDYTDITNDLLMIRDGWRLPTINELKFIELNKEKIPKIYEEQYWSSEIDTIDTSKNLRYSFKDREVTSYYNGDIDLKSSSTLGSPMRAYARMVRNIK
jgi:hypothetical protein